jgi:hypothetical protein
MADQHAVEGRKLFPTHLDFLIRVRLRIEAAGHHLELVGINEAIAILSRETMAQTAAAPQQQQAAEQHQHH